MRSRLRDQSGFALFAVLWITVLLALIAAGVSRSATTSFQLARNGIEAAKAEALADAGVWRGVMAVLANAPPPVLDEQLATRLGDRPGLRQALLGRPEVAQAAVLRRLRELYSTDDDEARPWPRDGRELEWSFDGQSVWIAIQDEAGKVDLNTGPTVILELLFERAGLGPDETAILVELLESGGVAAPDGSLTESAHRTWYTISELLALPGMTREVYARVAPALTVHSGLAGVDPAVAPRQVLLAIPGLAPATVEALLAARADPLRVDPTHLVGIELAVPEREVVTVRAEAETAGGGVFVREAVIELRRDATPPYAVLDWRRGDLR